MRLTADQKILLSSTSVFVGIIVFSVIFVANPAIFANLMILGFLIMLMPYLMYKFIELKKIRKYEEEFPKFLRDLSESQRAGLSIMQAIDTVSRSEYGQLTKEIKKMSHQLSWNVPLENVLENFGRSMKTSKIITRSLLVIDQANKSGGNIEDTMDSLASNIEAIRDVQEEKSSLLNQQVVMMYAIFFIFLGITIALTQFLIPLLQSQTSSGDVLGVIGGANSNPCYECNQGLGDVLSCSMCNAVYASADAFEFGDRQDTSTYYKSLFFMMIIVQGIFSGLIAGQIGSDSIVAGAKHSLIMTIAGFFTFITYIKFVI